MLIRPMSALGHKRTWCHVSAMSALPPKADMCGATRDVCFGPKADIVHFTTLGLAMSDTV
jgi:hypothetical protein